MGSVRVRTSDRFEVVDVTDEVRSWLRTIKAHNGLLTVYLPHTTAAITINEPESGLRQDVIDLVKEVFRPGGPWRHNMVDVNAHAHLAAMFMGNSRVVPVVDGDLGLGTWQAILLVEMDGPRERTLRLIYVGD